jgi:hypothetical protein
MLDKIEQELDGIEHYKKYPLMKPFIGENYFNAKKKILFIAESHYFDMEGTDENKQRIKNKEYINSNPSKWYSSSQADLHISKHKSIDTRTIVSTSSHMVFTELEKVLLNSMETFNGKAINNVSFMNGFQRPANKKGASIKYMVGDTDFLEGIKTIEAVINIIEPEFVIFISKFTWDKIGLKIQKKPDIKYEFIYHPASVKYWNSFKNNNCKHTLIEMLK